LKGVCDVLQPVNLFKKLLLAHGVVCGMEYLHSIQPHPVIHGDLKIQNVLVGDGLVAKVCLKLNQSLSFIYWFICILLYVHIYSLTQCATLM